MVYSSTQSLIPYFIASMLVLTILITVRLQYIINQSDNCRQLLFPVKFNNKSSETNEDSPLEFNEVPQSGKFQEFKDPIFAPLLEAYQTASEQSYATPPQHRFRNGYIPKVVMYINERFTILDWYYMHMLDIAEGQCPLPCTVTSDIKEVNSADAVLIHLLSIKSLEKLSEDLGKRDPTQPWIMFEPETHLKGNVMFFMDYKSMNGLFNRTMHYRWDSDILLLHGFIVHRGRDASLLPPVWRRRPELQQSNNTRKLAAAFISNCADNSGRLEYIHSLQKHAPVDVYGKCGNLKCGHPLYTYHGYRIDMEPCMQYAGRNYLFYLSFENALCKDYVTEKLYNILYYPVVPVVLGAANYSSILPPNSYINAMDYTPEQLGQRLLYLAQHPEEYEAYLSWRHHYQPSTVGGSRILCHLCVRLYDQELYKHKVIDNFYDWYVAQANCNASGTVKYSH